MQQRMTRTAAADGLEFRFDRLRTGSTFDAHRVLHLAHAHNLQGALKERLMRAYLTQGELMGDHGTLRRLATEVGLPEAEVVDVLAGDRYAEAVREDERTAASFGAHAVPFFVADRAVAASGAHPADSLLELLERGWEAKPRVPVVAGGEACASGGC